MDVTAERRYPVNVEELYGILTSRAFFEQRYQWGKVDDYRFEVFGRRRLPHPYCAAH